MSRIFIVEIYPAFGGATLALKNDPQYPESLAFHNESDVAAAFGNANVDFDPSRVLTAEYREAEGGKVLVKTYAITATDEQLQKLGFGESGHVVR